MIGERPATRSSRGRGRALDDPDQREKQLKAQLRAMSMYASHTSGDGNCLFRALSDQLYGYPSHYAILRHEICDYLEAAPDRFAGFVDIEKPFDEYIRSMRQSGTYGGHLELSAFASLKKKEIKIVQPGLVYVVTGDDDSSEAVAERLALEERRKRIQDRIPPGTEGPPPRARDARRRKRLARRSHSRGVDAVSGSARAGSSRLTAEPEGLVDEGDEDNEDLESLTGPVEAYGPLYIAYHNWEHYSSIRNLTGPHTGLPRIIERNVSLAAQQQAVDASSSKRVPPVANDVVLNPKPTECEELILRSVPGHTLSEVRLLLKQHGNLWETVVEVLIAKDAAEAELDGGEGRAVASSPPGTQTRSRGTSYSLGYANGNNGHVYRRDGQVASPVGDGRTGAASPPLLSSSGKKLFGRMDSATVPVVEASKALPMRGFVIDGAVRPTSSKDSLSQSSGKTNFSSSLRRDRIEALQSGETPSASVSATSSPIPGSSSSSYSHSHTSLGLPATKKRPAAAEADAIPDHGSVNERWSPRPRRSASLERAEEELRKEEEEASVDGALAAEFAARTKTSGSEERNGAFRSISAPGAGTSSAIAHLARNNSKEICPRDLHTGQVERKRPAPGTSESSSTSTLAETASGSGSTAVTSTGSSTTIRADVAASTASSSPSSPRSSLAPTSVSTPLSTTAPPSNVVEPVSPAEAAEEDNEEEEAEFDVSTLATAPSRTYTYSLQTSRNRLLSPPVSPRLLAARREEGNLSAREKREIELKRKRDRQRERRAQAKRGKAGKGAGVGAAVGHGEDDSGSEWEPGMTAARKSKGRAKTIKSRGGKVVHAKSADRAVGGEAKARKRRSGDDEYGGRGGGGDVPSSGFVELKI